MGAVLVPAFPLRADPTRPLPVPSGPPVIPLPTATQPTGGPATQVYANGANRAPFKVVVAPMLGASDVSQVVNDTAAKDFTLSGLVRMIYPPAFTGANLREAGLRIVASALKGDDGLVKARL